MLAALLKQQLYIGHLAGQQRRANSSSATRWPTCRRPTPDRSRTWSISLGECEQVYPAIHQVADGALGAADAAAAVMMITEGKPGALAAQIRLPDEPLITLIGCGLDGARHAAGCFCQ